MKNFLPSRLFAPVAATAIALCSLTSLEARTRNSSNHPPTQRRGTTVKEVTRSPGQLEKSTTYTSPTGKISTKESSRAIDPTTHNVTAQSSTTLANGKSASSNLTSVKTDTGRTTTAERTGVNGNTSTFESTKTKTENGFTRDAIKTGPNGGTLEKEIVVNRQDGTTSRTVTTTATPPPQP